MTTTLSILSLDQGKIVPKHYFEIKTEEQILAEDAEQAVRAAKRAATRKWFASLWHLPLLPAKQNLRVVR